MEIRTEPTVSGRKLVTIGLAVTAVVIAASLVFGPSLREQVRQETAPRTLREPVASGTYDGQVWEAVGRYDGTGNCVELRFADQVVDRACDIGPAQGQSQLPPDGPVVVYGVAAEDQTRVTLVLDDGTELAAPAVAGELGFPVSFWAVALPPGRQVDETDARPAQIGGQG